MPAVSEKQRRAMWAAAEGRSTLGIPEKVGKEFVKRDALSASIQDAIRARYDALESGTELDIARAIQSGELSSPQQFENLWLFDVRITGTGTSYRQALDEYVYRPPEDFLSEDFVQRCNGLPLIFEHPVDSILTTDEYRQRAIGTIVLPYIKGDEVWGIAKVYDDDAAQLMRTTHGSTSPAVVFRASDETSSVEMDDGKRLLIEGKPSYLDHLAICEEGVWDKGGESKGIRSTNEDSAMADEEMVPAWADALGKRLDALHSRLDALEKPKEDSEEEAEDHEHEAIEHLNEAVKEGEKKDAAEGFEKEEAKEEKRGEAELKAAEKADAHEERKDAKREDCRMDEKERKDSKRADAQLRENAELRQQIRDMNSRMNRVLKPQSVDDRESLAKAQARADSVARMFGDSITPPLAGESPIEYRKRCAAKFQKHSDAAKGLKLDAMDDGTFGLIEERIYADAQANARKAVGTGSGRLIEMHERDTTGRTITRYEGDPRAAWAPFMDTGRAIAGFNTNRSA